MNSAMFFNSYGGLDLNVLENVNPVSSDMYVVAINIAIATIQNGWMEDVE